MEYIDITLLRAMRTKEYANRVLNIVKRTNHHKITILLINAIKSYYDTYDHDTLQFEVFIPYLNDKFLINKTADEKQATLNTVKTMASKELDYNTLTNFINSLYELNFISETQKVCVDYLDGVEIDALEIIDDLVQKYKTNRINYGVHAVQNDIGSILASIQEESGLTWSLPSINKCLRPLNTGILGAICARPDAGKTSFIADNVAHWAKQVDRPILWLNNEGQGKYIYPRIVQSALEITLEELISKSKTGELDKEYTEATAGGNDKIIIVDVHGYDKVQIQKIIQSYNPAVVIFDMIDNIKGFTSEARTDLGLEKMYQWARETAVLLDFVGIATSQISEAGHNMEYPPMSCLKDSRTGKQGALDFQLMIGSLQDDDRYASTRWLSCPKNKLRKAGSHDLRTKVIFNRDKVKFYDTEN